MHIRPYQTQDNYQLINLWRDSGLTNPSNDPMEDIQRKIEINPEMLLVGFVDGKLIASVMFGYEGHRGWINYLAVAESFRGRGFGRKLIEKTEKLLLKMGCPKVNLQVRERNASVVDFYLALGYTNERHISLGKRLKNMN